MYRTLCLLCWCTGLSQNKWMATLASLCDTKSGVSPKRKYFYQGDYPQVLYIHLNRTQTLLNVDLSSLASIMSLYLSAEHFPYDGFQKFGYSLNFYMHNNLPQISNRRPLFDSWGKVNILRHTVGGQRKVLIHGF